MARPTWSRRSAIWPPSAATASHWTRCWSVPVPTAPSYGRPSSARTARSSSRSRSRRARPTGPDPAERRRFLADLLVARFPRYAAVRADYDRVLKQRNALLKSAASARRQGGTALRTLDVWDAHLATTGAALLAGRHELVEALRPLVDKAYTAVSRGGGPAGIDYRSSLPPLTDGADVLATNDRDLLAAALGSSVAAV